MKKLNWGIIGSGVIANEMAQALLDVNGEIYAVGHRDMNKAIDFAMKYKIKNAYGSVEELLNDPDVDVVYIATPHNSHYEIMKQAVAVKKHVLCEKAITVNDRQLEEIVALCCCTRGYDNFPYAAIQKIKGNGCCRSNWKCKNDSSQFWQL